MKERVGWKMLDGQKIFNIDFNDLKGDVLLNHLLFCCLETEKINVQTRFLINFKDSGMSISFLNYILDAAKNIQPYVDKSAILGITGFRKKLFKIYVKFTGSKACLFDDSTEAELYLMN